MKKNNLINSVFFSIITFLSFNLSINILRAQRPLSDPLVPSYGYIKPNYLGGFIGMGNNFQNGKYLVDCQGCEFEGGNGFNFIVGVNRDWGIERNLFFSLGLGYESIKINSTFREVEELTDTKYNRTFFAEFRHNGDISIGALRLMPSIRYNFAKVLFTKVGLNVGYVLSNNTTHTQSPVNDIVNVPGIGDVYLDTYSNELQNSEINNINKLQFGLNLDVGAYFLIRNKTRISPSIQYYLPFTDMADNGLGFNIPTLRFMLAIDLKTNQTEGDSMEEYKE